jgi:hypothetical protein
VDIADVEQMMQAHFIKCARCAEHLTGCCLQCLPHHVNLRPQCSRSGLRCSHPLRNLGGVRLWLLLPLLLLRIMLLRLSFCQPGLKLGVSAFQISNFLLCRRILSSVCHCLIGLQSFMQLLQLLPQRVCLLLCL